MEESVEKRLPWKAERSASFWERKRSFTDFLATSFALLEQEVPAVYALMCRQLAPRAIVLRVDADTVHVVFSAARAAFVQRPPRIVDVELRTTHATVLRVIDAETTLADAVLADSLELRGHLDALVAFHDGLMTYVHGAVRAPSFPRLLRTYRETSHEFERSQHGG